LEDLRYESESAARVFKNKMIEMSAVREQRIEANNRVIIDAEAQIISCINTAMKRLADVKSGKFT
jgi:hypothetical protein